MQNFVNISKSQFRSRSLNLLKNYFGTGKGVQERCCGPAKADDKRPGEQKKFMSSHNAGNRMEQKKAAVVLSGCGHLDGTCIYEAACVVVNLYKCGLEPVFFAPKGAQSDVINHQTSCPMNEERCAIREGARIARGKIQELPELRYCDVSCVIFPGGFGVTKTLTTFEKDKANCCVDTEVMRVLEEFHDARKPMAFTCIAAILPARLFPFVKVTLGMKGKPQQWPYQYAIDAACQMGAEVEAREVDGYSFDKQHMVFTTPAFMFNGNCSQVNDGISLMIQNMVKYLE